MIPGTLHPHYSPAQACEALACDTRRFRVDACKVKSCPHTWARIAAEDRARRELADRKDKERMRDNA